MSDIVKQYLQIQEKLFSELQDLENQIVQLSIRRDALREVLGGTDVVFTPDESVEVDGRPTWMDDVLQHFLKHHPGSSKAEIRERLLNAYGGTNFGEKDVTLLLSRSVKNKTIENRGTRGRPAYHLI